MSNTWCRATVSSTTPRPGAEMAAGAGHRLDQVLAQLVGDGGQLVVGNAAQVGRRVDGRQVGVAGKVDHLRIVGPAGGGARAAA